MGQVCNPSKHSFKAVHPSEELSKREMDLLLNSLYGSCGDEERDLQEAGLGSASGVCMQQGGNNAIVPYLILIF
jgi:hypothetical protein